MKQTVLAFALSLLAAVAAAAGEPSRADVDAIVDPKVGKDAN